MASTNDNLGWVYSALLTLQYAAQPSISKRFIPREVIVTSSVISCEVAKVICALVLLNKDGKLMQIFQGWTFFGSLVSSGLPAVIYALQNTLLQISYRNLDSITFSILNQTKLFFTALFTFLILRQKQSLQQIGALNLLMVAAVVLSVGEGMSKAGEHIFMYGIIPVLVSSVLSGLASALCQRVKKHSPYLMTLEMSIVGSICMYASTYNSSDGEAIKKHGFFYGWTNLTMFPILANALGGILVGLVTSYPRGVRKGIVMVFALVITTLLQYIIDGKPSSMYCLVTLPTVITSTTIYQSYPYRVMEKESVYQRYVKKKKKKKMKNF